MSEKLVVESSLYIVATPIGNLGDITIRAIETLKSVDCILTENVRHSNALLDHYGIKTKTRQYNDQNEKDLSDIIVNQIKNENMTFAIISDAGTPLISDPGFKLIQKAAEADIKIFSVPGPCALISALCVSGLPTSKFVFEGFLPPQETSREQRLKLLEYETRTIIFYEAPHRIVTFIKSIARVLGSDRRIVIAREITKRFESIYRGKASEIIAYLDGNPDAVRGEFVVIVSGTEEQFQYSELDSLLSILLDELGLKQSVSLARKISKENRNVIYERALKLSCD
jgi:16S rRNA (cytidine1402-2'-O)-methyltransferase